MVQSIRVLGKLNFCINFSTRHHASLVFIHSAAAATETRATDLWHLASQLIIKAKCHCHARLSGYELAGRPSRLNTLLARAAISFHILSVPHSLTPTQTHTVCGRLIDVTSVWAMYCWNL